MTKERQSDQYCLLKFIIDKELQEIDEEMSTEDNSDISSVVEFHIKHGIRDVEKRIAEDELTELEFPYGTSDELKTAMNRSLLTVELLLQYYYRACYFGSSDERAKYRQEILGQLEFHSD